MEGRASAACVGGTFGGWWVGRCLFVRVKVVSGLERGRVGGESRGQIYRVGQCSVLLLPVCCVLLLLGTVAGAHFVSTSSVPLLWQSVVQFLSQPLCSLSAAVGNGNISDSDSDSGFGIRDSGSLSGVRSPHRLVVVCGGVSVFPLAVHVGGLVMPGVVKRSRWWVGRSLGVELCEMARQAA